MFKSEATLDDLLRSLFDHFVDDNGTYFKIQPSKGGSREEFGVLLELTNPRSRLSRSELKGTPFSCLGELFWYLSGSEELKQIQYYLNKYDNFSDDKKTIYGAYGPRINNMHGKHNQLENVINLLSQKKDSRRAVIQIFDAADLERAKDGKDIPCTTNLQFVIRDNKLNLLVFMRSNDIYTGLPHDIFCFTMLQEIVANRLNVDLGTYKHAVGSLHLYSSDVDKAKNYLKEGWQSSTITMPVMPRDSLENDLVRILSFEKSLREDGYKKISREKINDYWSDIEDLLLAFNISKSVDNLDDLAKIKSTIKHDLYKTYIEKLYQRTKNKRPVIE